MKSVEAFFRLSLCSTLLSLPLGAASCDSLAALKLPGTTITAAQIVAPGAFVPPGPAPTAAALAPFKSLPAFCRVQGVIQPSSDSHIEFEVWLPVSGWNRDYMGVGNGGMAGSILYTAPPLVSDNVPRMAQGVAAGFAVSSTDTGHQAGPNDGQWALGHPEKMVDFGYRAIHETAEKSKAIIRAFYGNGPKHSYFDSCSNGGREALMEAQRFPADYDGIIAGAPAYFLTHAAAGFTVGAQATEADPASYIPASKLPAIEAAALAACDELDGLKDGLIEDPRKCHFDPETLLCQASESSACLTQPQVAALKKLYAGPRNSKGDQIYPGYFPGGETGANGWSANITGSGPGKSLSYGFAVQGGKYLLFQNPAWDYRSFDLDRDVKFIDDAVGQRLNAIDPNLKNFKSRGGKLILFHGWSDAILAPTATIDYYESVAAKMGRKDAESFTRLYMVPGMQHCIGGPGPNNFGNAMIAALQHWVEQGSAPDRILATKYKTDGDPSSGVARTRPLCPYPQVARYQGSGSIDEAANFACRIP
jgi:Tannase and feruloyl esterase